MNIKKIIGIGIASSSLLAVFPLATFAATSIANNGSFELGTEPGVFTTVHVGQTNISNWSVISGDVDYIGTYWQASDGTRSIDMTGDMSGAISQNVPTVMNAKYLVSFDLSGNPAGGPAVKSLNVDTGTTPLNFMYDTAAAGNTLADMKWMPESFTFTATSTTTPLTFTSLTPGFYGPALDNISVTQVLPTKTTECKNGGWMSFGVFKNQGDCVSFVATNGKNIPG